MTVIGQLGVESNQEEPTLKGVGVGLFSSGTAAVSKPDRGVDLMGGLEIQGSSPER
jgi:hypothetical protein